MKLNVCFSGGFLNHAQNHQSNLQLMTLNNLEVADMWYEFKEQLNL